MLSSMTKFVSKHEGGNLVVTENFHLNGGVTELIQSDVSTSLYIDDTSVQVEKLANQF